MFHPRRRIAHLALVALALLGPSAPGARAASDQIVVRVSALRSEAGEVRCALFGEELAEGFPGGRAMAATTAPIAEGRAICSFEGPGPGRYAVSMFHDENENGELDANFLGIPKEGYGASNNARGRLGPPRFEDASFDYAGGPLELDVRVGY